MNDLRFNSKSVNEAMDGAGAQPPDNSEVAKIAEEVFGALTYSLTGVAADSNSTFQRGTVEADFQSALKGMSATKQTVAAQSAQGVLNAPDGVRQMVFGKVGAIAPQKIAQAKFAGYNQLQTTIDPTLLGVRPNNISIPRDVLIPRDGGLFLPIETLAPEGALENMGMTAESFLSSFANGANGHEPKLYDLESERMSDLWGDTYTAGSQSLNGFDETKGNGAHESLEAATTKNLGFYISRVKCVDETNPEWVGDDEIALAGITIDESGDIDRISERRIRNDFDDGEQRIYSPHWRYTSFNLRELPANGAQWPKYYRVMMILAEKDNGGLATFLNRVYGYVRDKVKVLIAKAVSAGVSAFLGTAIGNAIGQAVAWVVDKLINWLIGLFKDDIFKPFTASCRVSSFNMRWGCSKSTRSPYRRAYFSGFGGKYYVEYYWKMLA